MKKIISICLAMAITLISLTAFAETETFKSEGNTKAIVLCYDNSGKLVYSTLAKTTDESFEADIPDSYKDTAKKVYYIGTEEFKKLEDVSLGVTPTAEPVASAEPTSAPEVTATPKATTKPAATAKPSSNYPAVYEKAVDAIYAPAMVKEVEQCSDSSSDEEYYSVTALYMGEETKIRINDDVTIETAPTANADMVGKKADSLEAGDIISLTANIAGDKIKHLYFICRPTAENIATSDTDYGTDFEKLFSSEGAVAGQWGIMEYGRKGGDNRYQYAFGIVGKKNGNSLTLINKEGNIDKAIEVDLTDGTIVGVCDTEPKDYDVYVGDTSDIAVTIPESMLNKGPVELTDEYSYNYALVRIVDGTATDVMLFTNYNN